MSDAIIKKLAEAFVLMKTDGMNIEKTVSSAMGICDAPAPREEVRWFARQMEKVLRENDHKGGWNKQPTLSLVSKLLFEVAELADAIENGDDDDVVKECVDIANYAMMIADECR
jgi:hypothetical protein